jgi:endonuclease/exonuclease/phosphatase family metal-dependent hydrolase
VVTPKRMCLALALAIPGACATELPTPPNNDFEGGNRDVEPIVDNDSGLPVEKSSGSQQVGCMTDGAAGPLALVCPKTGRCNSRVRSPLHVRSASWNIKVGSTRGLDAVIGTLRQIDADIVLLQEVDVGVERTGSVDQPRLLADALGYQYVFAPTLALEGGAYGIAMLARLPFAVVAKIFLTNDGAAEPRTAIEAHFCIGAEALRVINHHADYTLKAAENSVIELLNVARASEQPPTLFAGDFNQEPWDQGPMACTAAGLVDVFAIFDPTATLGTRRIDYFFADSRAAAWIYTAHVVATAGASDHSALVVDLWIPTET